MLTTEKSAEIKRQTLLKHTVWLIYDVLKHL
jgi:hypothetical protein